MRELIAQKSFQPFFKHNIETYVQRCDVCLTLKVVKHKLYYDLQLLSILTHYWKDLLINFLTRLPISTDWKGDSYHYILVIVNWLTKRVHYKLVKVTINAPGLVEIILDMVIWHHRLLDSIVTDRGLLFNSKFWSLLWYFFRIKYKLSIAFYP